MYYDYLILGAGPAGLQLAYFLHKENKNYAVLEKDTICSFFKKLPKHRKLISFNKPHIINNFDHEDYGKFGININTNEVHMRYDWNSLLSDNEDLTFRKYTEDFFPNADIMVKYMTDFSKINNLNVIEGINIINIDKNNDLFKLRYNNDNINDYYQCKHLIICTGLSKPNIPTEIDGIEHAIGYEELELNDELYKGKKIAILGAGNSAMETANYLLNKSSYILMFARSKRKLASDTHYVGDIRATHSNFFDVFQFKTLGIFDVFNYDYYIVKDKKSSGDKFTVNGQMNFDMVIRCLGFKFDDSIFAESIKPQLYKNKVPLISDNFQSLNVENLYFGGSITQSLSYKKGTYGFIHGFRYIMKYISNILLDNKEQHIYQLTSYALYRIIFKVINDNSCIFQLFENFCYVLLLDHEKKTITDIGEMPVSKALKMTDYDKILITYEYNLEKRDDQFDNYLRAPIYVGFTSRFFHPVLRYIPKDTNFYLFNDFDDLKYKCETKIQCVCGNFEEFNYMNKHTICKDCSNEAVCKYCLNKELISKFENNKCRKCRGNTSDNIYKKIYDNHKTNCIYRFDFLEQPTNIYALETYYRAIKRFFKFINSDTCSNVEHKIILENYGYYEDYEVNDENRIENLWTIKGEHPLYEDIEKRPFQINFLFMGTAIYPKTEQFPLEVCFEYLKLVETDTRRLEGLNSLINIIENIK
jgi:thioredoxin reductase|tara:strand:+ start:9597 stop:11696 length:2100 start_codon:yes stop_codon:yes gene_type:complete